MCFEALVRPTNRPLLACSLPSFGDRVAIYPPLLNPEEDGTSLQFYSSLPPLLNPWEILDTVPLITNIYSIIPVLLCVGMGSLTQNQPEVRM